MHTDSLTNTARDCPVGSDPTNSLNASPVYGRKSFARAFSRERHRVSQLGQISVVQLPLHVVQQRFVRVVHDARDLHTRLSRDVRVRRLQQLSKVLFNLIPTAPGLDLQQAVITARYRARQRLRHLLPLLPRPRPRPISRAPRVVVRVRAFARHDGHPLDGVVASSREVAERARGDVRARSSDKALTRRRRRRCGVDERARRRRDVPHRVRSRRGARARPGRRGVSGRSRGGRAGAYNVEQYYKISECERPRRVEASMWSMWSMWSMSTTPRRRSEETRARARRGVISKRAPPGGAPGTARAPARGAGAMSRRRKSS